MKRLLKFTLAAVFALAVTLPAFAGIKTEAEYIADLSSPKEKDVVAALQGIEKVYPTSVTGQTKIKSLLADSRPTVKRKAARTLGALGADVSSADLNNIVTLLSGPDKNTIIDGLKALRGLKAQSTVPKIIPLLQNADKNVKRDACRTLAVLGDKSTVPSIQPLLQDADKGVVKDAGDAIAALNAK